MWSFYSRSTLIVRLDQLAARIVRPGDVVLDVGANIGQTARVLSPLVGKTGRCICFEAEPHAFRALATLAAQADFGNVEPYCRAISNRTSHEVLFFGRRPDAAQASTIVEDLASVSRLGRQIEAARIESDTIDTFCAAKGLVPRFIKIDVEGAEDRVLDGAEQTLATIRPPVVFEFGYQVNRGTPPRHFDQLQRLGYQFYLMEVMFKEGQSACLRSVDDAVVSISPAEIVRHQLGGNLLAMPAGDTERHGIEQVDFASVSDRVELLQPTSTERAASVVRKVERVALNGVGSAYWSLRSAAVSGARRVLRLLRSGR